MEYIFLMQQVPALYYTMVPRFQKIKPAHQATVAVTNQQMGRIMLLCSIQSTAAVQLIAQGGNLITRDVHLLWSKVCYTMRMTSVTISWKRAFKLITFSL